MQYYIKFYKEDRIIDTHLTTKDPTLALATILKLYPEYADLDVATEPYTGDESQPIVLQSSLDEIENINQQMAFIVGEYRYAKDKKNLDAVNECERQFDALSRRLQFLTKSTGVG